MSNSDGSVDPAGPGTTSAGVAQRLMRSPIVATIYDRWWRPALGRAAKGLAGPAMAGELRILRSLLQPTTGDTVVDVACGPGTFTGALARDVGATGRVLGVDVSATMVAQAARTTPAPQVGYVLGDATRLPVRPGSADAVCCFGALHLFRDPGRALDCMVDALTPGGRLALLTTVCPSSRVGSLAVTGVARLIGLRVFDANALARELSDRGLDVRYHRRYGLLQVIGARHTTHVDSATGLPGICREERIDSERTDGMAGDERRSEVARRLDDEDPLDRIAPDEGDDEDVERAWEEADVDSGEAPTG